MGGGFEPPPLCVRPCGHWNQFGAHNACVCACVCVFVSELGGRMSGIVWTSIFISLAAMITMPRRSTVLTFVISAIIRCISSVGVEPTLMLLGVLNVSRRTLAFIVFVQCYFVFYNVQTMSVKLAETEV